MWIFVCNFKDKIALSLIQHLVSLAFTLTKKKQQKLEKSSKNKPGPYSTLAVQPLVGRCGIQTQSKPFWN